jgi:aminopeptidase-like protein
MTLLELCKKLYPINRSLTGNGVRATLEIIKSLIPIEIKEVKSGTRCFDWTIPPEWNIYNAYIIDLSTNNVIIDLSNHNLHIVGYSINIDTVLNYEQLVPHLYYIEDQPEAIPYITSYYSRNWGFCLKYSTFKKLDKNSKFKVVIDSNIDENGSMTYGELIIPGETSEEIFISSYICHPQMVNNELSGVAVLTFLAKEIYSRTNRKYTYRFVLIPETIGSIYYLSLNFKHLKNNVFGGFNISCVGDERAWGHLPSRIGNNISDLISRHVLKHFTKEFVQYTWLDRGSDERQYCSPGIDLPISSISRSKFGAYPEYHTSLDDFNVVTQKGLEDSFNLYLKCLFVFENNCIPKLKVLCEPQLGKRGLYPNISTKNSGNTVRNMMNFISYCDGELTLIEIAEKCGISFFDAHDFYLKMVKADLIF